MAVIRQVTVTDQNDKYIYFTLEIEEGCLFSSSIKTLQCFRRSRHIGSDELVVIESGQRIYSRFSFGIEEALNGILDSGAKNWVNVNLKTV